MSSERALYTEETLRDRLTWQNLGYRLGFLFDTAGSETDPVMIDEMFEWCAKRYRDLSVRQRRGMEAQGSLGGERGPVGDPRSAVARELPRVAERTTSFSSSRARQAEAPNDS